MKVSYTEPNLLERQTSTYLVFNFDSTTTDQVCTRYTLFRISTLILIVSPFRPASIGIPTMYVVAPLTDAIY